MTILLPTLGVGLASFCVWLGVRIVNRRERWARRTAVLIVVLAMYPLSFGPACLLCERGVLGQEAAWLAYRPIAWTFSNGHGPVRHAILVYANLWGDERRVYFSLGPLFEPDSKSPLDYELVHRFRECHTR